MGFLGGGSCFIMLKEVTQEDDFEPGILWASATRQFNNIFDQCIIQNNTKEASEYHLTMFH